MYNATEEQLFQLQSMFLHGIPIHKNNKSNINNKYYRNNNNNNTNNNNGNGNNMGKFMKG